ncbi:MAG: hypothetical protein AAGA60_07170 [Cyanobacteria bacterium P01_E01_bin.42]
MNYIYLANDERGDIILAYNPDSGESKEIENSRSREEKMERGYYTNIEGNFYGIYASVSGPIFFKNESRYLLSRGSCRATLETENNINHFTLYSGETAIVSVSYQPSQYKDYDNWSSDEELTDMFLRIKNALETDRFFEFYTQN